uniref:Fibronectin type-III domain-containing protein n=1 Tax=Oryzias melastigma TaxID=30732 RepID=A0A3B3DY71_ORYME
WIRCGFSCQQLLSFLLYRYLNTLYCLYYIFVIKSFFPGTSQITLAKAINSSSLQFEWSLVTGADRYILVLEEMNSDPLKSFNWTFTSLSEQPPTGLTVTTKTASSVQVQWNPVNKVLQYLVVVRDSNNPNSPDIKNISSTSAEFSSLKPCSTYTVEVSSYNIFLVPGEPSIVTYTTSSPCEPTNVKSVAACDSGTLITTWEPSAGALSYSVEAMGNNGEQYKCSSTNDSCAITGVPCGEFLTSVSGNNFYCNSTQSQAVAFTTGPCPPANVKAFPDCDTNHAVVNWQNNQTSGHHTAMIEDGTKLNSLLRLIENVVISHRFSPHLSVPCAPVDVKVSVNCSTEDLTISWSSSSPAEKYSAVISGGTDQPRYCNSTDTYCTLGGLRCGSLYNVSVSSFNGTCLSPPSSEVTVQTTPCPPTNVSAVYTCSPNPVAVSWVASGNAKQYTAVALSQQGHKSECTTNQTSCSLPGLQCGEKYSIRVSGANDICSKSKSKPQIKYFLSQNLNQWLLLSTSNCTLSDLVCGQDYDIQVSATDGKCASNYSAPFVQSRGTKTRELVQTFSGILDVTLICVPEIYSHSTTCSSSTSNCTLSDLVCGQDYDIRVSATDGKCTSNYSAPFVQSRGTKTRELVQRFHKFLDFNT